MLFNNNIKALVIFILAIILANCASADIDDLPPLSELSSSSADGSSILSSPSARSSSSATSFSDSTVSCIVGENCLELSQSTCATIGGTHVPSCTISSSSYAALPASSSSSVPNVPCLVGASCIEIPQNICATVGTQILSCPVGNSFIDTRDGQTYNFVEIGNQTWMAKNLNYNKSGSKCYDNETYNCVTYGRLYDWETAITVCPSGWHLPTRGEWDILIDFTGGGLYLKSEEVWGGSDTYGFAALPGGYDDFGEFREIEEYGNWWTSDYSSSYSDEAILFYVSHYSDDSFRAGSDYKNQSRSVRCVKD